jgi:hypothetical protein
LAIVAVAFHEKVQHRVHPGEVVPLQQEILAVEHLPSEEPEDEHLRIKPMEVEHQPGMPVVQTKLQPGQDLALRLLLGVVVLEIRRLRGVQLRDLGRLRGGRPLGVVLRHGEGEMVGEHRDGEKKLLERLGHRGIIRLKLRLLVCGMHRLLE